MSEATKTSPLLATLLSLLWPGLGHLYVGAIKQAAFAALFIVAIRFTAGNLAAISLGGMLMAMAFGLALLLVCAWDAWRRAVHARATGTRRKLGIARGVLYAITLTLVIYAERAFSRSEAFTTPAGSMVPALRLGDQFMVDRWAYRGRSPKRGDIVTFFFPRDPKIRFVKRVIGLPGDRIAFSGGNLIVNGKIIVPIALDSASAYAGDEKLVQFTETIEGVTYTIARSRDTQGFTPDIPSVTVPEASYYVLGDNRDFSNDSRFWGFVPANQLIGRAVYVWANFQIPDFKPRAL